MKKKTMSAYLTFSHFVLYVQEQADSDIVNDPIYGKMHSSTAPTIHWEARNQYSAYQMPIKSPVNQMPRYRLMMAKGSIGVVCVIETMNCIIVFLNLRTWHVY